MKKIMLFFTMLINSGFVTATLANTVPCPSESEIQNLKFVNADPHDSSNLWDASTENFKSHRLRWNVVVQNFKMPLDSTEEKSKAIAKILLNSIPLIQKPISEPRPDDPEHRAMCIYLKTGGLGTNVLIAAYEYGPVQSGA